MPFELNTQVTPQHIHFIWVGGPIYPEYLRSIHGLAQVAQRDGYDINLWVDDEKNYYETASREHLDIPNLKIRNIRNELYANQKHDPFYQGQDPDFPINNEEEGRADRSMRFQSYVERELIGFHNFAAAADLLRLEILRQEGGWYFDTDTYFPEVNPPFPPKLLKSRAAVTSKILAYEIGYYHDAYHAYIDGLTQYNLRADLPVIPVPPIDIREQYKQNEYLSNQSQELYQEILFEYKACLSIIRSDSLSKNKKQQVTAHFDNQEILQLGIAVNSERRSQYDYDKSRNLSNLHLSLVDTNNDIIGAVEDSFCIKTMILDAMGAYKNLDKRNISKSSSPGKKNSHAVAMDKKRYPNECEDNEPLGRRNGTIGASGPRMMNRVVNNLWRKACACIKNRPDLIAKDKGILLRQAESSLFINKRVNYARFESKAAGIRVESICDNTWLGKKKLSSFDTEFMTQNKQKQQFDLIKSRYHVNKSQASEEKLLPTDPKSTKS